MDRRAYLANFSLLGTVGLAGCLGGSHHPTDVVVHNVVDERQTIDLTIIQRGIDSPTLDTSLTVQPNSRKEINNDVLTGYDYHVKATVTGATNNEPYTETKEWTDARGPLHIILNGNQIVFAVQIG